jgi:PDZ domain-containing protein
VRRAGAEKVLKVRTIDAEGKAVVGILLRTEFVFPTKVSINAGDVGGPSAGMMFSLAIYDKLTPGSLTGGLNIAGTGTINSAGAVGPIGGIQQKLVGAKRGGAVWFLAPADNCNEVVGHVPEGLKVVKVATFTQARDAVMAIAAKNTKSLPTCK